jgi:hypothetical protein
MTIQSLKKQLEAINGCQEESMQLWQEEHESELADDESISAGETVYLLIDKTELIIEHKHGEWSSKDLSNIHDLETLLDGVVEYNKVSIRMLLDDRDADRGGNDIWRDNITILNKLVKCTELVSLELELGDLSMQEGGGEDEQLDDLDQQLDKIKTIVRNNKHLKKFHLKRTDIHPAGEKILAKELVNNRSLTDLQLSNVGMITWDDGGCLDLCKSGIFSRLKKLDLSNNLYIWDAESPNNNFLENLGKYLKDNSSITELNLAWNNVGIEGHKGSTTFMNTIHTMSSLTRLILSNNSFRGNGYDLLAAELKKTKSLKELDMSDNVLGLYPSAMREFANALLSTNIIKLNLSGNFIPAHNTFVVGFEDREDALEKLTDAIKKKHIECNFGKFRWRKLTEKIRKKLFSTSHPWPVVSSSRYHPDPFRNYIRFNPDPDLIYENIHLDEVKKYTPRRGIKFTSTRRKFYYDLQDRTWTPPNTANKGGTRTTKRITGDRRLTRYARGSIARTRRRNQKHTTRSIQKKRRQIKRKSCRQRRR